MRIPLISFLAVTPIAFASALSAQDTITSRPSSIIPEQAVAEVDTVDRIVAVVGNSVITWSDVVSAVNQQRARGMRIPDDVEGQLRIARIALSGLIDEEILVQKAADLNIDVSDQELNSAVENQVRAVRQQYKDEIEYRAALREAGFGSPEEFRRSMVEQIRRYLIQGKVYQELRKTAKPASVSDEEVNEAFQSAREQLRQRPPTVTFRQLILAPQPSPAADSAARRKADSLLAELKKGENFEAMAKRESMDPGSRELGGDLGWNRRGMFVPEFEAAMFSLRPGQLSPVIKTQFGYHIIRVDRVQPAEVKASHILIAPEIDSTDIERTYQLADSVAQLWSNGMNYDSLVAKFHDRGEEKGVLEPYPIDSLPESYRRALEGVEASQVTKPFELRSQTNAVKIAILQVVTRTGLGEYSLAEVQQNIRRQLAAEKQSRAILDELRQRTYVSIRL
jgi:peptidyl-prolyl cis-trans isomerase SurA